MLSSQVTVQYYRGEGSLRGTPQYTDTQSGCRDLHRGFREILCYCKLFVFVAWGRTVND